MTKYQKEIESLLFNYEKDLDKKLYKAYANSLREIKREIKPMMENIDTLNYTQRQKLIKDVSLQLQIEQQMDYLNGYVTDNTYKFLNQTGEIAYNGLFYEFEQLEGFNTNFTMLPTKTIETIVQTSVEGLRFSERIQDGTVAKLRSNFEEVFRVGFTKGYSYQKMAQQLSDVSLSSYKRSMRIARTEGGRVQAVTRQMSQQDALELGIRTKKKWVSTLDGSTRDTHRKLDGQVREVDEYFEVNGHKALQPHMFGVPEEDINCRCRSILILDGYDHKLRRDNETKKPIKYQTYQEWEKAKYPVKTSPDKIKLKSSMLDEYGKPNYDAFHKTLNALPESHLKDIFRKHGNKIEFQSSGRGSYASKNMINLEKTAFKGDETHREMETVYHEMGHAVDSIGLKLKTGEDTFKTGKTRKVKILKKTRHIDIVGEHLSSLPEYDLKNKINSDLWNYMYEGKKPYSKGATPDSKTMNEFIDRMKNEYSEKDLHSVSDMFESTGWMLGTPLGSGHGHKYWKTFGTAETEFFAHATETVVNKNAGKLFKEVFQESYATYEQMLKDILKGG